MISFIFASAGGLRPRPINLGEARVGVVPPPAAAVRLFEERAAESGVLCSDTLGIPELRDCFAAVLRKRTGWAPPIEHIAVIRGTSAVSISFAFEQALLGKHNEILSWLPQWFGYRELFPESRKRTAYATLQLLRELNFQPRLESLRRELHARIGAVVIPDLVNPLGVRIPDRTLAEIFRTIYEASDAVAIHDQHFLFNLERANRSVDSLFPAMWKADRYVGLTSLRLGFAVPDQQNIAFCWGPRRWIMAFAKYMQKWNRQPDVRTQLSALACLQTEGLKTPAEIRRRVKRHRKILDAWLHANPQFSLVTEPGDGPHVALDLSGIGDGNPAYGFLNAFCFVMELSHVAGVTLMPTSQFGLDTPGARINLSAVPEADFAEALQRISDFVRSRS